MKNYYIMALSGIEFKSQYGTKFYKMIRKDFNHCGFVYKLGENIDTIKFDPSGNSTPGGLCFTTIDNLMKFSTLGSYIGIIEISDDAEVYIDNNKFKANKITISKIIDTEEGIINFFKSIIGDREYYAEKYYKDYYFSIINGNILKTIRNDLYPWNNLICCFATKNDYQELLKWLKENKCECDKKSCKL